jgi:hypothetical protein
MANLVFEVGRRIEGRAWQYKRGSSDKSRITTGEQISAIRQLCQRMDNLRPKVTGLGGYLAESPMTTIERLISVVKEKAGMLENTGCSHAALAGPCPLRGCWGRFRGNRSQKMLYKNVGL